MKITIPNPNDCSGLKVGDKVFVCNLGDGEVIRFSIISDHHSHLYWYVRDSSFYKIADGREHEGRSCFIVPATPAMIAEWERERAEWRNGVLFDLWMMIKDIDNNDAEQIAFAALLGDDLLKKIETKLNSRAAAGG